MIATEYAGCMSSTKPSKRGSKRNWTWLEATLTIMYGREGFRKLHLYALRLYNFVRGFKRAYNWTKKSVSKSYNRWQNELRHFTLTGLFELFFLKWSWNCNIYYSSHSFTNSENSPEIHAAAKSTSQTLFFSICPDISSLLVSNKDWNNVTKAFLFTWNFWVH